MMIIFQILAKNEMMIFQNLGKIDDFSMYFFAKICFQILAKNDDFSKYGLI